MIEKSGVAPPHLHRHMSQDEVPLSLNSHREETLFCPQNKHVAAASCKRNNTLADLYNTLANPAEYILHTKHLKKT